ncbi:esterase family protein [Salmonella enterica]|uniref:Esterase family protein n=1 Tax=Salmonella enterica subsp. VII serovar 40:z4,z24:[z39] TaxID=1967625 RepID=A0A731XVH5_SALEE|nr:esterase family protein [Salmonella enterica]EDO5295049.1 esterase family protein [Salmonella enterica subsp. houtenae serovar 40:z4,z24:-]QUZ24523.1 esterase family protein [Salmonella enterica subsp. VII str. CFSAN000554]HAE4733981.1 esterase family protein [Salmonella enterica subsp. VII serovar 40:z4,z24:[z39]]HBZ8547636.1 esterase family protein [Salmonella enterica subsp. houtenae]HCA3675421.1 esterase family protein [Salmonella enterica subsp. houtenae serovar Houten]
MRLSPPVDLVAMQTATRLRRQLDAGSQIDASHFWREATSLTLPLVTAINGADDEREVTFLWRAAYPLQGVYVRLNRVTDKENVMKGMMTQLPTTDIWHLTLRLPASYCGSYTMVEIPQETPDETVLQLGSRFAALVGQADPLNKMPGINVRGNAQESILALDNAPPQEEWSGCHAYAGQLFTSEHRLAGQPRRVRLYLPEVPVIQPLGLLVLTDGEIWFDHIGVSAAIDAAINSGRIAPVAVLGVDNIDERERVAILGGRRELVLDIAEHLLPTIRARHQERQWAARTHTVLAGQSLGGVTALMAARHAPESFGLVLSHSPSMWWAPDNHNRPGHFSGKDRSWVSEHVLSAPSPAVRTHLCVGSLEGSTVPQVKQLHENLRAAGVESHCDVYTGGHDYAWWRGALIDGLSLLPR